MIKIVYTFKPNRVPVTKLVKDNIPMMDKLNWLIIDVEPIESVDEPEWIEL